MGGIMGGSKPAAPPPPPIPTQEDPAVEEARRKELLSLQKSRGRAATILTGGDGDTSQADVAKKRLLGE